MNYANSISIVISITMCLSCGCKHTCCRAPVGVVPPCAGCGQKVISGASPKYAAPMSPAPIPARSYSPGMGSAPLPYGQPLPRPDAPPPAVTDPFTTPPPSVSSQSSARLQSPRDSEIDPAGGFATPMDIPTDLPQFNLVYGKVASSLYPFPEGYQWLKSNGYRTVLILHAPEEDITNIKQDVEGAGLKCLTLQISASALNSDAVKTFEASLAETSALPLLVVDKRGHLAGLMWYAHFRKVDGMSDAQARLRAQKLGLPYQIDSDPEQVDLWRAVQNLVEAENPPVR